MSDDVKDVLNDITGKNVFPPFPSVLRLSKVQFGVKPALQKLEFNQTGVFVAKIVDDSNFVPNSDFIRNYIVSGSPSAQGIYDFSDGKDTGFTPKLRGLGFDPAEVDAAAAATVKEAADRQQSKLKAEQDKAKQERNNKILDNLANLSEPSDSSQSSQE